MTSLSPIVRGHQQLLKGSRFHSPSQKGRELNARWAQKPVRRGPITPLLRGEITTVTTNDKAIYFQEIGPTGPTKERTLNLSIDHSSIATERGPLGFGPMKNF